ncbi:nucleic acid-binding, OB-fold protein [Artemisia annua]|uniref:Nucleic acid-binding, OB-fold protein n=1 Tax=Artemisia annua TaxID=35608 RepID=A0A2U1MGS3_ARTAN|nr:nucleic acid-binding, OB-fold protein [Artemisia annua]
MRTKLSRIKTTQETAKYKDVPIGDSDNATKQASEDHIYNYISNCSLDDQPTSTLNGSAYLHLFGQKTFHQQPKSVETLTPHDNSYFSIHEPTLHPHGTLSTSDVTEKNAHLKLSMSPATHANKKFSASETHKRKSGINGSVANNRNKKFKGILENDQFCTQNACSSDNSDALYMFDSVNVQERDTNASCIQPREGVQNVKYGDINTYTNKEGNQHHCISSIPNSSEYSVETQSPNTMNPERIISNDVTINNFSPIISNNREKKRQSTEEITMGVQTTLQRKKRRATTNQSVPYDEGVSKLYTDLGDASWACQYCNARFWYGERLKGTAKNTVKYNRCCGGGQNTETEGLKESTNYIAPTCLSNILFCLYMANLAIIQKWSWMTESYIKQLKPGDRNRILEAKVYRAWIHKDPPDTTEKGYRVILLDKQANMEASDIKFFNDTLIPGKTYRISNFKCVDTDNWQQTLANKTSLSFTRFVKLDPIDDVGFPAHYFDFISYNQLPSRVVDPKDRNKKPHPVLTDYIGCYMQSGEKEKIGNPNRHQTYARKVEIQNLNRNSLEVTLWGDLAEHFPKEGIDALEKPIIIAVTSCRVSRYYNSLQLSATPATYYYINPQIPQLEQYLNEYRNLHNIRPPLQIVKHPFQDKDQEKIRNRFPLAILMKEDPHTHIGVRFTCEAWITSINTAREWYYISCDTCINKVEDNAGTYECKIHGQVTSPHYRYNFKVYITDGTETAMLTCFTPKANYLIGTDCNTLVKSLKHPDPKEFPQKINEIIGKKHIFQFHFNTGLTEGKPNFILNEILDKEDTPKELEPKSSAAGQTGKATGHLQKTADPNASSSELDAIDKQKKTNEQPIEEKHADSTIASETNIVEKQNDTNEEEQIQKTHSGNESYMTHEYIPEICKEQSSLTSNIAFAASETTPPPPVTTPETSTNKMESESSEKKSAKRQLFQHKPDDSKKIKKE